MKPKKAQSDIYFEIKALEGLIKEVKKQCEHKAMEKHAGGGGGLGSDHWLICNFCGGALSVRRGEISEQYWKEYKAKINYHSCGN